MKRATITSLLKSRTSIALIFSSCIMTFIHGQEVASNDLVAINGNWEGKLVYVDYGDDKTQYALNTKLDATWEDGKGTLKFEFEEPNGKLVYSTEKMKLLNEKEFKFNGKWQIIRFEKDGSSWEMTLESRGKDNNKESTLREEISFENNTLLINKMVKYDGTDEFFLRNSYNLNKTSEK